MARLFHTGWEAGSKEIHALSPTVGTGVVTTPTRGSWSTYAWSGSGGGPNTAHVLLTSAVSEFYFGTGFYYTEASAQRRILNFVSPNGTLTTGLWTDTAGHLKFVRGDGAATLATSSTTFALSTWYYIEGHVVVNSSTGSVALKVNGVQDIAETTSLNTRGDGAAGGDTVDRLGFAPDDALHLLDDFYFNDTTGTVNTGYSGDIRIKGYIPSADGSNSGMTLSTGTSHFAVVDDVPPNDATDYAYGTGTTEVDTLNIPNTSNVGTVQAVMLWVRAQKSDAGAGNIATVLKSGATTDTGSDQALSTSWAYYRKVFNQDPNGTINWTASAVDSMEIGAKSR